MKEIEKHLWDRFRLTMSEVDVMREQLELGMDEMYREDMRIRT